MVKATLRKPNTPAPVIDAEVVETEGTSTQSPEPSVEHKSTVNGQDLTDIIPTSQVLEEVANPSGAAPNTASNLPAPRSSSTALAATSANVHAEGLEGDWGSDDLKYPQLKIVQGSGELSKQFDNGTIIYNEIELLPAPSMKAGADNKSIRFIPVIITKQFREKLSQEAVAEGEMPRIFNSLQEVEDAGLTTRWIGNERPANFAEPSAKMVMLIEQPEGVDHPGFVLELDGKCYAVAVYYAAGGAFRDSAKVIFNTALTSLLVPVLDEARNVRKSPSGQIIKKPMLWKNFWTLNFVKKDINGFVVWRPVVKLQGKAETGPEVRAYCDSIVHGAPEAAAQAE